MTSANGVSTATAPAVVGVRRLSTLDRWLPAWIGLAMIAGLLRPDAGQVRINGSDMVSDPIATKRHLGLVPQDLAIYPELSARSNLLVFGRLQGMRGSALRTTLRQMRSSG